MDYMCGALHPPAFLYSNHQQIYTFSKLGKTLDLPVWMSWWPFLTLSLTFTSWNTPWGAAVWIKWSTNFWMTQHRSCLFRVLHFGNKSNKSQYRILPSTQALYWTSYPPKDSHNISSWIFTSFSNSANSQTTSLPQKEHHIETSYPHSRTPRTSLYRSSTGYLNSDRSVTSSSSTPTTTWPQATMSRFFNLRD